MTKEISILDRDELLHRLHQESARALRYGRQFCILVISFTQTPPKTTLLKQILAENIRVIDVAGWDGDQLVLLFPEIGESAEVPVRRLLGRFTASNINCTAGISIFPVNGTLYDQLVDLAKKASLEASTGQMVRAESRNEILTIDDQPVIAADPRTRQLFALVENLSRSTLPVLVFGETGVGKEIVAKALHYWSPRSKKPLVSINCAAMPETLLESELFGHVKGAFSGAVTGKKGLFEMADGGTLFLDEVSEAPARIQAGLLRVLETKKMRPVGATAETSVNVRIIAATNRNLPDEIEEGRFRRDLYYRLCAASVYVPLLVERPQDLAVLANTFLDRACRDLQIPPKMLGDDTLTKMKSYAWPGNIRELKNLMEYSAATIQGDTIRLKHLPKSIRKVEEITSPEELLHQRDDSTDVSIKTFKPLSDEIEELERRRITEALIAASGVKVRAAGLIGMPLRTMLSKIKKYRLTASQTPPEKENG